MVLNTPPMDRTETSPKQSVSQAEDEDLELPFAAVSAAFDKKAENILILDLRGRSSLTDFFVIASAMSPRQVQTIAEHCEKVLKEKGFTTQSVEGLPEGRWVLQDYADMVLHIFLDPLREYYDLEGLWAEAPRVPLPKELFDPRASQVLKQ